MGFPRQEYWSGLPFLSPRDLFDPGVEPASPTLAGRSLPLSHQGSPHWVTKVKMLVVQLCPLFLTPLTVACQAPLSTGFSRPEYWSGLPFPSPGDLPDRRLNQCLLYCRQILYHLNHREALHIELSVQFSSVTQSCPTLWDPMNHSTPGLPVHHQLPEFTQTHVHQVSDAI